MRGISIVSLLTLSSAVTALALKQSQPVNQAVLISFPDDTPPSVLAQAAKQITDAGGMITHEFGLIKALAAEISTEVMHELSASVASMSGKLEVDGEVKTL